MKVSRNQKINLNSVLDDLAISNNLGQIFVRTGLSYLALLSLGTIAVTINVYHTEGGNINSLALLALALLTLTLPILFLTNRRRKMMAKNPDLISSYPYDLTVKGELNELSFKTKFIGNFKYGMISIAVIDDSQNKFQRIAFRLILVFSIAYFAYKHYLTATTGINGATLVTPLILMIAIYWNSPIKIYSKGENRQVALNYLANMEEKYPIKK